MSKLYELSSELATINDEIITADGEITPDLEARLDSVNLALTEKATGLRKWLATIEGDDGAIEAEVKRLQRIKKQGDNLRERLKAYIKLNMEIADKKKIETPIGTFSICKSPTSLEIIEDAVPDEYKTEIPAHKELTSEDKKRIKDTIEEGYEVPGAKLVTDKTHLRMK
jgi:hypothetical protein